MFDQIFGNYLVKTGRITKEQLSEAWSDRGCREADDDRTG